MYDEIDNLRTGEALRNQPPADMSELRNRLGPRNVPLNTPSAPVYTAGPDGVSTSAPAERTLREKVNYTNPQMEADKAALRQRIQPPAAAPAAAPVAEAAPSRAYSAANKVGNVVGRVARVAGPVAAGAAAMSELGTYQINDPGVDSSAGGTIRAVANGDLSGARRSLGKGALEAGMDVGGMAAGAVDTVLPGQPATTAYNKMLKSQFGDQLKINDVGALRSALGLHPDPVAAVAQPAAAAAKPTAQTPVQRVANDSATRVAGASKPAASPIAQAAQPQYELGRNAVEIIRPGGDRTVETFGPNGNEGAVPSEVFNAGQTAAYRKQAVQSSMDDMADPRRNIAQQRVANEGELAKQDSHNKGLLDAANVRHDPKVVPPSPIKDVAGNVTGYSPAFAQQPDGTWKAQPVQGLPQPGRPATVQKAHDEAKKAIKNGANPVEVNARLSGWNYPTLNLK